MTRLIGAFSVAAILVSVLVGPAAAASQGRTVFARINGGGTAQMQPPGLTGTTSFGGGVTLYVGGSASGQIDCVDQQGSQAPGNIWGPVTGWSPGADGAIVLHITHGKFHPIPGGQGLLLRDVPFDITIQRFGGAGVGRWTLSGPFGDGGAWITVCFEILTSGQIVYRRA